MTRSRTFLAALAAVLVVPWVTSAGAEATTTHVNLSISAVPLSVDQGQAVTVSGRAGHAAAGTRVQLQRWVAGSWHRVAGQRVTDGLRYSFTITPPRGHQRYRTRTVARPSQPSVHSLAEPVAVHWHPRVIATGTPVTDPDGSQWVDISGTVRRGPKDATVELRLIDWDDPTGAKTLQVFHPSGSTPFTVQHLTRDHGYAYQLVLDATDVTYEADSYLVDNQGPPFVLPVNGELHLQGLREGPEAAIVGLDLTAGQEVTLSGAENPDWDADVTDPSGTHVTTLHGICTCTVTQTTFTAAATGTYLIILTTHEPDMDIRLWTSVQPPA